MNEIFDAKEYWEKRLKENYDLSGTGYAGLGICFNKWVYRVRKKVFRRLIRHFNSDLSRYDVLDIGSGTGFYLNLWKQAGARSVNGSDITNTAVDNLKKKYPESKIFNMDIGSELPSHLQGYKFNIISAFDVLFHIVDDGKFEKAISNISELLDKGGFFVFSDNFLHGRSLRMKHQVCRELSYIEKILREKNCEIIERVPMCVIMNFPVDTEWEALKTMWNIFAYPVRKFELFGYIAGAALYPIELLLTSVLRESPTTEAMICRKL